MKKWRRKKTVKGKGQGRILHQWSGPDDTFDFGKHQGCTFREVYLTDPGWTARQDQPTM